MNTPSGRIFHLKNAFVNKYRTQKPDFGFNGLGELVYRRTYSRLQSDGTREEWYETIRRVVEGAFSIQKKWMVQIGLEWNEARAQEEAEDMYDRFFTMKCLPPGRGLYCCGSALTTERGAYGALNNCAFISTASDQASFDPAEVFCFIQDFSMLGVGIGFDTEGAGLIDVVKPGKATQHVVQDSREGWVESLRALLNSFFKGTSFPIFDYSEVRPAGELIRGFGGVSQGPQPLQDLHEGVVSTLQPLVGSKMTSTAIVDIGNLIGKCVIAGNVRRSAEIAIGDPSDNDFLELKDYAKNPQRAAFGWASNNSVSCSLGEDYDRIAKSIHLNGEPGDWRVKGANPCVEQSLESAELCCLVETFPNRANDLADYLESIKTAINYAKTVTLCATSNARTNEVMLRNRRIGCSMSGLAQFLAKHSIEELRKWCEAAYQVCKDMDVRLSERWCVPQSIKITSIKPSGTVSLLAGATPGVHFPESNFYIRRVRVASDSELLVPLERAGYPVEDCVYTAKTKVVSIPVSVGDSVRVASDVSMWEQVSIAAFLQRYWADNQVSCTVTFDPETEGDDIVHALNLYQYSLKGISFLPRAKTGTTYPQSPYEAISDEQYQEMAAALRPVKYVTHTVEAVSGLDDDESVIPDSERFCDGEKCLRQL
ncbi:hypothetical protein JKP88DRAFT_256408 [Tribonema minus]|uniref:ribonucleoside-triphosphate reductase (thioredoxin) n=1 Tax=Tribonema minus TaxID=303371 RepID=A0A835Z3B7_9STRA|nr:hypothetical protein JKP88DRAFT_260741 [Tribonema minus]KAG5186368.1 hypothetical protein JKP88DRAFT_256408 [Tribonema minus]